MVIALRIDDLVIDSEDDSDTPGTGTVTRIHDAETCWVRWHDKIDVNGVQQEWHEYCSTLTRIA